MRFFKPEQMLVIERPEDISCSFLESDTHPVVYNDEFSPRHFASLLLRAE